MYAPVLFKQYNSLVKMVILPTFLRVCLFVTSSIYNKEWFRDLFVSYLFDVIHRKPAKIPGATTLRSGQSETERLDIRWAKI